MASKASAEIVLFGGEMGLSEPMKSPSPSLILIFDVNGGDGQIGAFIRNRGAGELSPASKFQADLEFWADEGRLWAITGAEFRLWYNGRIVGVGRITD